MFQAGGCVAATAPILIVDFLNGRLNAGHVSGLLVNDAHRVTDNSREAFVIRLFRQARQKLAVERKEAAAVAVATATSVAGSPAAAGAADQSLTARGRRWSSAVRQPELRAGH